MSGVFHARRRPVALIGVGAAPITAPSNRRLAVNLVRHADLLVLRDDESAELLGGLGAPTPLRVGAALSWPSVTQPGVEQPDRKSVVEGKRVSVRVEFGGGRSLKTTTNNNQNSDRHQHNI